MTTAKTFNRFDDILHRPLRIFNRAVTLLNINSDFGRHVAEDYVEMFSQEDRKDMFLMIALFKKVGQDEARRKVTKGLEVVH